jgi:hypothetical protein
MLSSFLVYFIISLLVYWFISLLVYLHSYLLVYFLISLFIFLLICLFIYLSSCLIAYLFTNFSIKSLTSGNQGVSTRFYCFQELNATIPENTRTLNPIHFPEFMRTFLLHKNCNQHWAAGVIYSSNQGCRRAGNSVNETDLHYLKAAIYSHWDIFIASSNLYRAGYLLSLIRTPGLNNPSRLVNCPLHSFE